MASRISVHERVVFMLWGKPEVEDLVRLCEIMEQRVQSHGKVVFIARVPPSAEAPDAQFRNTLSAMLPRIFECCLGYHGVLEGTGFATVVKRAAVAGILLMSRQRQHIHIHATIDDVAGGVDASVRLEVMAALRKFGMLGLLDHSLASVRPPPRLAV